MNIDQRVKKANDIIEKLPNNFKKKNMGKFAAVEILSGDCFFGRTEWDAFKLAKKKYPKQKFVFLKVGSDATHFVGVAKVEMYF
ncbi:hypothetical protein H8E88_08470 [candidate division KSB1 bacterium]|nr:hypothetical protein [candidate division KSB1 bacterium]MBL7095419.1 hypothetical protein [candidate division KSB1 bacterium]